MLQENFLSPNEPYHSTATQALIGEPIESPRSPQMVGTIHAITL